MEYRIFGKLFIKETEICLDIEKDRFYSNNLPVFYSDNDLKKNARSSL